VTTVEVCRRKWEGGNPADSAENPLQLGQMLREYIRLCGEYLHRQIFLCLGVLSVAFKLFLLIVSS